MESILYCEPDGARVAPVVPANKGSAGAHSVTLVGASTSPLHLTAGQSLL
jgi:hypothetical protein